MPPPPPPPVPGGPRGPPAPPPPAAKLGGGSGSGDRGALLSAIRTGKTLKKTQTNDRSAPVIDGKSKPSTNGAGGGGGGMGMMNGGAPQLAGLFAGGMPKLRPTGKGISTSPSRSGPLLPPGRKPAPGIPSGDSADSDNTSTNNNNNSIPPSPKPSSKSNPAPPPPPPANLKPTLTGDRPNKGPLPPPPTSKPAPPRPPMDDRPAPAPPSPDGAFHPALPSKPALVGKPSLSNKPAPPRPPNGSKPSKPTLPPKITVQPNGDSLSSNKTARANSMRVNRSDLQNHRFSAEENLLPSRTLPPSHHHKSSPGHPAKPNTVGRYMGVNIVRSMTRPPTDRPPPPPISRPSVPPPSQPPPPPPSRAVTASKPELPSSAPPPPPSRHSSQLSRSSGKGGPTYYGTLPSKLSHRSSDIYSTSTLRAKSMDLTYSDEEFRSAYSRSQSLECSVCVLEAQAECRECEENLYQQRADNCRECVEYGLTRGEDEYLEENVSCFACGSKPKKFSNESKKTKRSSKRKEAGKQKTLSVEEEMSA